METPGPQRQKRKTSTLHAYGASQHSIFKIVQYVREGNCIDTLPESYSGWLHRNRKDIKNLSVELESKIIWLPEVDWPWHTPSLSRLIQWHLDNNFMFNNAFRKVIRSHADPFGSPVASTGTLKLHLVGYCDEFTPGNVLAPDIKNKCNNWYASFLEFGDALRVEHVWMHVASLLSRKMARLSSGCSCASRWLLESFLDEVPSVVSGMTVAVDGQPYFLIAELNPNCWDEKALKEVWFCKGSGGKKPCLQCPNVVHKTMHDDLPPGFVDICEPDASKFGSVEDSELYEWFDELAAIKGRGGNIQELEIMSGVKYDPTALLGSIRLRGIIKPSQNRYDVCHTHYSNGIVQHEIDLVVSALGADHILTTSEITSFFRADWKTSLGGAFRVLFKDNEIKCDAQGVRTAVHVFRHLLHTVVASKLDAAGGPWRPDVLASFRALHDSVCQMEYMMGCKDYSDIACDTLGSLMKRHLELFVAAHGHEKVRPKHHMSLHVPNQVRQDRYLLHAFPLEHKHKLLKDILENYHNTNCKDLELRLCCKSAMNQALMVAEITSSRAKILSSKSKISYQNEIIHFAKGSATSICSG